MTGQYVAKLRTLLISKLDTIEMASGEKGRLDLSPKSWKSFGIPILHVFYVRFLGSLPNLILLCGNFLKVFKGKTFP
jgi:hypothetical protein